ncbi:PEPxxWA-CTERM sorting domain-containing protein [Phenylobacterium sp.]|uniref:PEPxxWA-CTERM sorting domain-containing protein n=1 Tax=Phenylobacterium sp. TaxID=1871053 RepID=UPI0025CD7959|nr:PEPxxWA-CTERM sorting domain-containing protein [Phenylobacterium sp.]
MLRTLFIGVVGAVSLGSAGAASALTYTSQLEYRDGLTGAQTPYGTVTLNELDANTVKITVTLANPNSLFVNTGGPHDPFLFNLPAASTITVNNTGAQDFSYAGDGSYTATPFGTFIDKIACCVIHGGPKNGQEGNGQANGDAPPLIFTVYNAGGLSFAGVGATFNPSTGKLLSTGTGNHFTSNSGGWWFAADIYDGATGQTYNVAARDAFTSAPVPEPAAWALMITGFGAAGAMLRRRRAALA